MTNCKYITDAAKAEYEKKKRDREFEDRLREEELEKNENYSKAKYSLKAALFDREKALFLGNEKKAAELDAKISALKTSLSAFKRVPQARTDFDCPVCKDEGVVDGEYCRCFAKKVTRLSYEALSLSRPDLNGFEDDSLSQENNTSRVLEKLKDYCDGFWDGKKNLFLFGSPGSGKTFIAKAVTKRLEDNGFSPLFLTAFRLNDLAASSFNKSFVEQRTTEEILYSCDFLVIDDLGSEPIYKTITVENLLNLISRRLELKKPFMITTNLDLEQIRARYGDRVFSRTTGKNSVILEIKGKDLRKIK